MEEANKPARVRVSFIVPAYNEESNVVPLYDAFAEAFADGAYDWELVYVDDGSTDATFANLRRLVGKRGRVRVVSLSRNFGKEAAIWAGLNNARGDVVGIIDADLQQSPADARAMVDLLMAHEEADVVAAYQERRHEGLFRRACVAAFYRLLDVVSDGNALANASDFRVFRRNVAQAILGMPEYYRFTKGIFAFIGFKTIPYAYAPAARHAGASKWGFCRLVGQALEGLIAFSTAPLRMASYLGLLSSALALVYFVVVIVQKLCLGIDVPGYATIVGLILLIGGVQLIMLGVAGEYIGRTYIQGKHRPIYIEARSLASADLAGDGEWGEGPRLGDGER